ncbi:hypothetical protein DJ90_5621 [Paenibacillus macerans]|uniref:Uncharacterized protein n=1 Tax=Paenibacillus macerans TaxID=44252 RepID=A0A090XHE9_PAEMA|nr:hypothetical protein DJ90_5621 [Paenibacillus macerans]
MQILTFRELRRATSGFETVFLTFFHPRVTSQEACFFQRRTEFRIRFEQSAGNPVTDCAGLAGNTAAMSDNDNVVVAERFRQSQRLFYDQLQRFQTEIIVDIAFIDDNASFTRYKANTSYRMFTTTCPIVLYLCHETVLPFNYPRSS